MIIGLGNDLCDIRRIEDSISRFGDRFLNRIFTESEQARANTRVNPSWSYAKRFAAKEAAAKALGTGFAEGVFWKDLEVVNNDLGQPVMQFSGGAEQRLTTLLPKGFRANIRLTMTDEYPLAQAICIIEAVPADWPL